MKFMIASDIHGSAVWCKRMLDTFAASGADRLILLGDLLYHGPRNDLPEGYAPKEVIALLSPMKQRLFCVRGNCEAEVDQMVLPFPVLADYAMMPLSTRMMMFTHGHHFHEQALPPLSAGDILVYGHTHVPLCKETDGILCLNPGSVAIPKEQSPHSCMLLEGDTFSWLDLSSGTVFKTHLLPSA